jgi:DNA (cytosine-5)-methyltransferase 1
MAVGLQEAARRVERPLDIRLAVDVDENILAVYAANLPVSETRVADVSTLFDRRTGEAASEAELKVRESVGEIEFLLGGPPCQGHSDLNNHTRRRDPTNLLYVKMARAAEILTPGIVIIENVAPVQLDHAGVVKTTADFLTGLGYRVSGRVIDLSRLGVPQTRRRFLLLASMISRIDPDVILEALSCGMRGHPPRTVRWAIADLLDRELDSPYETASAVSETNMRRMSFLFRNKAYDLPNRLRPKCHRNGGHSYVSVYGRLRWDRPAQTITTGFGSMGQGRYVHPARPRTITPHEAARLQTFPDWFGFGKERRRSVLAKAIGNAVPPILMVTLGGAIIAGLSES